MLEDKLLIYCARADITDNIKERLSQVLQNNLNWPYILKESRSQAITSLVYLNLSQFKHSIPEDIWMALNKAYYGDMYRNVQIYEKMNEILSSFNKEGLNVIPLKGIFLMDKVYNNLALRSMYDIDLLIKQKDLTKIDQLLNSLGYNTPIHKELLLHAIKKHYMNSIEYFKQDENLPSLHLHWHIVNVTLPTYLYTKNIKMDRFWECARPVTIQDLETLQLSPYHLILHLAEHALKHSFDKLILLSDMDAVIKKYKEEIDWKELIKESIELGMKRQLFYGLYFTKHFLNTSISNDILSQLKPKKFGLLEQRFFNSILNNKRNTKLCYFVYLNMVKCPINKLRFIFRTLFPPPSVLALAFNLDKPKVTIKDYLLFLRKQLSHLKNCLTASF